MIPFYDDSFSPSPSNSAQTPTGQTHAGNHAYTYPAFNAGGTWSKNPIQLPQASGEGYSAVVNDILYTFGDSDPVGTSQRFTLLAYDLITNSYKSGIQPRSYAGDHTCGAVYNNKIYTFTGLCCQQYCGQNNECGTWRRVQVYDIANNVWETNHPQVPWNLEGGCQASLLGNNKIIVSGGMSNGNSLSTAGFYNPATKTWETNVASLPQGTS